MKKTCRAWDYTFLTVHGVTLVTVTIIIALTRWVDGYRYLLRRTTVENGLFELASVFVLLALSVFCCVIVFQDRRALFLSKFQRLLFISMACFAFLVAMEEVSWGQQIFGFQSGEFFDDHNLQKETNLHNLIPAMWLSTAINVVVYGCFIIIPLLYYCDFKVLALHKLLAWLPPIYWPSHYVVLMMAYSSSLHHYFSAITWSDTAALILSLIALLVYWLRVKLMSDILFTANLFIVIVCSSVYAACYDIFSQYNLQYEIREFVVVCGVFYWMVDWSLRLKEQMPPWLHDKS